jgi:hypothetical protein
MGLVRRFEEPIDPHESGTFPRAKALPRIHPEHRAWQTPLPLMKIRNPNREHGRRTAAVLTDLTLLRRGTSSVALADSLACGRSLPEGWRDACEGIQLGDLLAIHHVGGTRDALAILDAVRTHILNDFHGA